ncbi:hypothetical protein [Enterobacter sp. MF024]|nr:hypothetical protein [Enterobacter sp. MF024]
MNKPKKPYLEMIRNAVKPQRYIPKGKSRGLSTDPKVAPVDAKKYGV